MTKKQRMKRRSELYQRQGCRCFWCGELMLPFKFFPHKRAVTIEHIVPISKGGSSSKNNLTVAHKICNEARTRA